MSTLTWYNCDTVRLSAFHHLLPASYEYHRPPSSPAMRWSVLVGSTHTSWKSQCAPPEMLLKLLPPSVLTISGPSGLLIRFSSFGSTFSLANYNGIKIML